MISTFRFCIREVSCSFRVYSTAREARILEKLIKKGLTPKKKQRQENSILNKGFLSSPYDNEGCGYRLASLNKVYMEHITEMLHNGSNASEVADLGIEVTKVALSKNFDFLNIYFILKKPGISDKILKETLNPALGELQAKMGELRYLGKVPYLKFVRDKMMESSIQVEKIFQVMDFGRDFEPGHEKKVVTQDYPLQEDGLPKMRQNVFGVDVPKIKRKITEEITRFKAINIETCEKDVYHEHELPEKLMVFNKKDFIKFFKRRRIAELKRRKLELRELNSLENEFQKIPNKFEDDYVEDEDYVKYKDYEEDEDYVKYKDYEEDEDYVKCKDYEEDEDFEEDEDYVKCKDYVEDDKK